MAHFSFHLTWPRSPLSIWTMGALAFTTLMSATCALAQDVDSGMPLPEESDSPLKYAIYSSAWGENSNAGLRLVAQNQSTHPIRFDYIVFQDEADTTVGRTLEVGLTVPPGGWAEAEFSYLDLLFGSECITETMTEDWKLVEISNYTLNPSVRGLIIEDTDSFRIYQCVRNVFISWENTESGETHEYSEWVMYHFERRPVL